MVGCWQVAHINSHYLGLKKRSSPVSGLREKPPLFHWHKSMTSTAPWQVQTVGTFGSPLFISTLYSYLKTFSSFDMPKKKRFINFFVMICEWLYSSLWSLQVCAWLGSLTLDTLLGWFMGKTKYPRQSSQNRSVADRCPAPGGAGRGSSASTSRSGMHE